MNDSIVYKICTASDWASLKAAGQWTGAAIDVKDGYVHLSSADQVAQTLKLHFAGQEGLLLLSVSVETLGDALVWEPSRGGALFPHLYAPLPATAVVAVYELLLAPDGRHVLPACVSGAGA